jgi:hypothetical protein
VPACLITPDDLRRLFALLAKKAQEAAKLQTQGIGGARETREERELKERVTRALELVVRVEGANGAWTGGTSATVLADESLPASVVRVTFDSAMAYRNQTNSVPSNSFLVNLEFGPPSIFDFAPEPEQNQSSITVSGTDPTWVNGLYEELQTFFKERVRPRGWLHIRRAYDIALLFVGFPASFAAIYRLDRALRQRLDLVDPLYVAFYVYAVLIVLWGFRILFNYSRWVFPKLEGPDRREGRRLHKAVFLLIGATLVSLVVETFLRMVGIQLL